MNITDDMLKAFSHYNHNRLNEKLADIHDNFEDYFDEGEASPILPEVFNNTFLVLNLCDDNSLASWTVEPFSNGTIMLVSKNKDSVINIGVSKYSCSMEIDGNSINRNATLFNEQEVASLILRYYIWGNYKIEIVKKPTTAKTKSNSVYEFNVSSKYATV